MLPVKTGEAQALSPSSQENLSPQQWYQHQAGIPQIQDVVSFHLPAGKDHFSVQVTQFPGSPASTRKVLLLGS